MVLNFRPMILNMFFSGICFCMDYENELKDLQRPVIKQNSKTPKVQKTAVKTNDYKNKLRSS